MGDGLQTLHVSIEQIADEVRAAHRAKFKPRESEDFRRSEYAGLTKPRFPGKYRDCEYVIAAKKLRVRKLSQREIDELQPHVQRCMEARK